MILAAIHDAPTNPVGAVVFLVVIVAFHAALAAYVLRHPYNR